MRRRILIAGLVVLLVANAVVIGAWMYRDDLQDAGVLPAAELPTRADFPEAPLPPLAAEPADPPAPDAPDVPVDAPQPQPDLLACVLAGPFEQRQLAVEASRRLAEQAAAASVLAESVAGEPDYLVFVVPAADAAAQDVASELQAQDVSSFVIPSGARTGSVSVGVFRSQARAQAQQTRVASLGHDVQLATIDRKRSVYRVRAQDVPPSALRDLPHEVCAGGDDKEPLADAAEKPAAVANAPPAQ